MNENRIILSTNAFMAMVVAETEAREMRKLPSLDELNKKYQPSEQLEQRIEKLLKSEKARKQRKKFWRAAQRTFLSLAVVLSLFTCAILPVKAVQTAVINTLIEWYDQFAVFAFSSDEPTDRALPENIALSYVPEGFKSSGTIDQGEGYYRVQLEDGSGRRLCAEIYIVKEEIKVANNNENALLYTISFDGHNAVWTSGPAAWNDLIYEENGIVYHVSGEVDVSELIKVMQGIET